MDLPLRDLTIEVELDEDHGVVAVLETLTALKLSELMDENIVSQTRVDGAEGVEEIKLRISLPQMSRIFQEQLRELRGVDIQGDPFDVKDTIHMGVLERSHVAWHITGGTALVAQANMTTDQAKNSEAPEEHSQGDSTPDEASAGESED